jgi:hypothetical protein
LAKPMHGADLDVGPAVTHPDAALAAPRVQSLKYTANSLPGGVGHTAGDRDDASQETNGSHEEAPAKRYASRRPGGMCTPGGTTNAAALRPCAATCVGRGRTGERSRGCCCDAPISVRAG